MHLVQLLIPLRTPDGPPFPAQLYADLRRTLTERFGGLTASTRAPAAGLWKDEGHTIQDDMLVYEVLVDTLDRAWWARYRETLRVTFQQEDLLIRAWPVERL